MSPETPEQAVERLLPTACCPEERRSVVRNVVAEIRAREKALVERCARIADQDGATYAKHRLQREADACAIVAESIRGREGKIREQEQGEKA